LTELTGLVSALQKKVALLEQRQRADDEDDFLDEDASGSNGDDDNAGAETQELSGDSPFFAGPTSANYSLGIASLLLDRDGNPQSSSSRADPDLGNSASYWENDAENDIHQFSPSFITTTTQTYGLQLSDAHRLIQVYRECVGILHPVVEIETLIEQTKILWPAQVHSPLREITPTMTTVDVAQLKLALAVALLAEGGGSSAVAAQIYAELQLAIAAQMMSRSFSLKGQVLLLLAVRDSFWVPRGWRLIGTRRSTTLSRMTRDWHHAASLSPVGSCSKLGCIRGPSCSEDFLEALNGSKP
jgi:hypothetical protein